MINTCLMHAKIEYELQVAFRLVVLDFSDKRAIISFEGWVVELLCSILIGSKPVITLRNNDV